MSPPPLPLLPSDWSADLGLWALAFALLAGLLLIGTAAGRRLGLHQWGIPEALIAGSVGLALAPDGLLPLLPPAVIQRWDSLPLALLTLVFGTLLLGKPLPRLGGLWRPLSAQVLMALTLAFGQYLVAGLALLLVLQPLLGVAPAMACLIEVAFEGGHGSAAAMGPVYEQLGVEGGTALGLAMATVGLLASTVVGGVVVVLARRFGWLTPSPAATPSGPRPEAEPALQACPPAGSTPAAAAEPSVAPPPAAASPLSSRLAAWAVNLALVGIAVGIGCLLLWLLRLAAPRLGSGAVMVIEALPVFPLALIGSLLVRLWLERTQRQDLVSAPLQTRIGTLSADLLIAAATACLDLSLLARDWLPLLVLALAGLGWNLAVLLLLAPRLLPAPWFSRGIIEFGQATGVAASGLLLLNMADPQDSGDALTPFSIKQLLLQPLLAGGVITVVAPLAVNGWGLPAWTGLSLVVVLLASGLGLWLARQARPAG
ncbi:MAG: sodium/glutamate symporter [Synechococcaceae cyanobacterium]|nr:sodium/glutamate symporter [Synechococcaceae cyanobacterium]